MLMVMIFAWGGRDLVIQPANDMQQIKRLKRQFGSETEVIVFDSEPFNPIHFDPIFHLPSESERIEWLNTTVYPAWVEEGIMTLVNGKYRFTKNIKSTYKP